MCSSSVYSVYAKLASIILYPSNLKQESNQKKPCLYPKLELSLIVSNADDYLTVTYDKLQ